MKQNAQLMAMIYVDSVEDARGFYVDKLGFTHMMGMLGKDGQLDFCTVSLGGARVMAHASGGRDHWDECNDFKTSSGTLHGSCRRGELPRSVEEAEGKADVSLTDQWWRSHVYRAGPVRLPDLVLPACRGT